MITAALLASIAQRSECPVMAALAPELEAQFAPAGINTPLRIAHFLGQAAAETWAFTRLEESLSYGAARIVEVFGEKWAPRAAALGNNPHGLANAVYAERNGNGDEASGDGWLYRGRGCFDLTGRANYRTASELCEQDFVSNPDMVSLPHWAVASAIAFWTARNIGAAADQNNGTRVTMLVAGSAEGLIDRSVFTHRALHFLAPPVP